jgi:tRNA-Thr(GGU) m(6)t(6)A37 methyltransferase TsaA
MNMSPIGNVRVNQDGFILKIRKEYIPALEGIENFTHLDVLWWFHRLDTEECRSILVCDKPYKKAPERLGVFAIRSPVRPNPVALSVVNVLHVDMKSGIINIAYIDAENGSPIIDLKPYHPCTDRVKTASVPAWCAHWPQWYEDSGRFDWQAEFVNAR